MDVFIEYIKALILLAGVVYVVVWVGASAYFTQRFLFINRLYNGGHHGNEEKSS